MNIFDLSIVSYLNGFANKSSFFDWLLIIISDTYLIKVCVPVMLLWFFWFQTGYIKGKNSLAVREHVIMVYISCIVAVAAGKLLAFVLPLRHRPIADNGLDFIVPDSMVTAEWMIGTTSFPSNNAVLAFSLAMGIWLLSKRFGLAMFIYLALFVAFPRIYLGLHYPTDILGGAAIGMVVAFIGQNEKIKLLAARPIVSWSEKNPGIFYMLFFMVSFEFSCMLESVKKLVYFVDALN